MPEDQKPRTRKQAQIYGAGIVDNTAQKTFKLKRVKEKAKPDPSSSFVWQGLSPKFKQKSLNTFVEKNRFGIDTVGELQGITAKGLLKQRQMRMMGIPIKKKKKSRKRRKK